MAVGGAEQELLGSDEVICCRALAASQITQRELPLPSNTPIRDKTLMLMFVLLVTIRNEVVLDTCEKARQRHLEVIVIFLSG